MSEDRDILIEIRSDMKHVREDLNHLKSSDKAQWEKLDLINVKTEGHDKTLSFLTWITRGGIAAMVALAWDRLKGGPQ